jgi:hypothetical protein
MSSHQKNIARKQMIVINSNLLSPVTIHTHTHMPLRATLKVTLGIFRKILSHLNEKEKLAQPHREYFAIYLKA